MALRLRPPLSCTPLRRVSPKHRNTFSFLLRLLLLLLLLCFRGVPSQHRQLLLLLNTTTTTTNPFLLRQWHPRLRAPPRIRINTM